MTEIGLPLVVVIIVVLLYALNSIKILKEYERGVVFNLGRVGSGAVGPGVILVFRPVQQIVRVSLRQEAMEVTRAGHHHAGQRDAEGEREVITLRVVDPVKAVIEVSNYVWTVAVCADDAAVCAG